MKKEKLITVRVSEDLQTGFNQWLRQNRLTGSDFLRQIIQGCIDGTIPLDSYNSVSSQCIDSIDTKECLDNVKKLETRLCKLENSLSSLVTSYMSSQFEVMKQSIIDELSSYSQGIDSIDTLLPQSATNNQKEENSISTQDDALPFTHEDAKKKIKELNAQGVNVSEIAKELNGKYPTATGKLNWVRKQVERIIEKQKTS